MAVSKQMRFEVFKRDKFTCQYCGKKAPDVILHADHIEPKSKGGKNTLLNLTTACDECNLGKGARRLSDDSAVEKQRAQLEVLQEKQEQLTMMVDWQKSLLNLDQEELRQADEFWKAVTNGYVLTETGKADARKILKRYGLAALLSAMRTAGDAYLKIGPDGIPLADSATTAFSKLRSICSIAADEKEKPWIREVFYIRGILKNRLYYVNLHEAKSLLERAFLADATPSIVREIALTEQNWTNWQEAMWSLIAELEGE